MEAALFVLAPALLCPATPETAISLFGLMVDQAQPLHIHGVPFVGK